MNGAPGFMPHYVNYLINRKRVQHGTSSSLDFIFVSNNCQAKLPCRHSEGTDYRPNMAGCECVTSRQGGVLIQRVIVRFLELVRPFMSILPEVTAPERKVRPHYI